MFVLAHISDVHLGPLPKVRKRDLISKRITGYANWKLNRSKTHGSDSLTNLIANIREAQPDHTVITGDLVNLALRAEFNQTKDWLPTVGPSDQVSVIPGNHDAYVRGSLAHAKHAWGEYMPLTKRAQNTTKKNFPYMRQTGPVAIIGASSAVASPPFLSLGYFEADQAERMHAQLLEAKSQGLFRVILIHHPPFRYGGDSAKRLYGVRLFQHTILSAGAELVLHGHTHIPSFHQIGTGENAIPVIGVPSASQAPGGYRPAARWNRFEISGDNMQWNCQWSEHGIQDDLSIKLMSSQILWQNGQRIQ